MENIIKQDEKHNWYKKRNKTRPVVEKIALKALVTACRRYSPSTKLMIEIFKDASLNAKFVCHIEDNFQSFYS
jgi:hypothetical protein